MLAEKDTLYTFKICLATSILLHVLASILCIGYHSGDEHYQILEFAGLKLGFNTPAALAWEYHYQMRSALQPLFAIVGIKFFNTISITDPFTQAILFRLFSSVLSILSSVVFIFAFINDFASNVLKKWFIAMSLLLWIIVYTDVRFSSECWSASLSTLGVALLKIYLDGKIIEWRTFYLFLTGFVIGLSFVCRYQTGFFIVGMGLWLLFINKAPFKTLLYLVLGALIALGIGIAIDSWFYGKFTLSTLNYFTQNIVEDKVSNYGISPWWYYITNTIEDGFVFLGLLSIAAFLILLFKAPKNILVWSILPFILIHSLIGHKESRFLFPIIKFAPYIVFLSFTYFENTKVLFLVLSKKAVFVVVLAVNFCLTAAYCFTPADYAVGVMKHIRTTYSMPVHFYYMDNNPYENFGLFNHYYLTKNVTWGKAETLADVDLVEGKEVLLVVSNKRIIKDTLGISYHKVYQSIPEVFTENLTGWASRHTMKVVYRCEKTKAN